MNSGRAYTYGLGKNGELGNASNSSREITPFQIPKLTSCISAKAGGSFSLILLSSGQLYASGKSKHGRSGIPDCTSFTIIPSIPRVTQISAGYWHSLFIDDSSQIWSTGYNAHGQLGLGHCNSSSHFVPTNTQALSISAGGHTSLAISLSNTLLSCGKQSGHPSSTNTFREVPVITGVTFIDCGQIHSACVACGQLFTWGNNTWGQLGHSGKRNSEAPGLVASLSSVEIVKVSCSKGEKNASTGCIDRNRRVFMWGSGYKGKLGLDKSWSHEDPADRDNPEVIEGFVADQIELGGIHSSAIGDGVLFTWGCGSDGRIGHPEVEGHRYLYKEPVPRGIEGVPPVVQVSSSYYHNIFIS